MRFSALMIQSPRRLPIARHGAGSKLPLSSQFNVPGWSRHIVPLLMLALLICGCVVVLLPLAAAIAWSVVIAYVTWPFYRRACRWLGRPSALAPASMTALVSAAVVVPILWLVVLVHAELLNAFREIGNWLPHGSSVLPAAIHRIPVLGPRIDAMLTAYLQNSSGAAGGSLAEWLQRLSGPVIGLLAGAGRNVGKLLVSLLVLFFIYRDGERVVAQTARVMRHLGASKMEPYLAAAGAMTRAVIYGFLITALAQGLVAGIGYRIAGASAPVLLGALTAVLSILPLFGTALVWVPVAGWLLASGDIWQGLFLLAWGALVVHPIDNLLHPLLISSSARAPFPLVFLGVLGGLAVFGLIGIVVGPVLLGLALVLWRQWDDEERGRDGHASDPGLHRSAGRRSGRRSV